VLVAPLSGTESRKPSLAASTVVVPILKVGVPPRAGTSRAVCCPLERCTAEKPEDAEASVTTASSALTATGGSLVYTLTVAPVVPAVRSTV